MPQMIRGWGGGSAEARMQSWARGGRAPAHAGRTPCLRRQPRARAHHGAAGSIGVTGRLVSAARLAIEPRDLAPSDHATLGALSERKLLWKLAPLRRGRRSGE